MAALTFRTSFIANFLLKKVLGRAPKPSLFPSRKRIAAPTTGMWIHASRTGFPVASSPPQHIFQAGESNSSVREPIRFFSGERLMIHNHPALFGQNQQVDPAGCFLQALSANVPATPGILPPYPDSFLAKRLPTVRTLQASILRKKRQYRIFA